MQEELANLVHPVFTYGLHLRDRLELGEEPRIEVEQTILRGLLLSELEARRWSDFGGSESAPPPGAGRGKDEASAAVLPFLGVRYALACWLDEIFILHSPWGQEWNERKLEMALYGSNDRSWRFWQQAALAERRPTPDALEVFYLCTMLGFRGEYREQADRLRAWVSTAQQRLTQRGSIDWPHPPELDPPVNVPPLRGRARFQRVVWLCGAALLVLIPIVAFFFVQQLRD
jgi:type VI secretion system protein ImpK